MLSIQTVYDRQEEVLELFSEYIQMLLEGAPHFSECLQIQNYEEERRDLLIKYGPPGGRLYGAFLDGELIGTIALRKLSDREAEIKRLYVKPGFRRLGIGKQLVEVLLKDAGEIGYESILLDTLPFLTTAIWMYKEMGFYEIERYNDSPMAETIYMKLDLKEEI